MSPTVIRGLSEEYGSWKTIWMLRRIRRMALPRSWKMSSPLKYALPLVGVSRRISSLASVDLPHPDSPTMPSVSPLCSWNDTPSTALTAPTWRLNTTPTVSGKCLTRFCTSRITSPLTGLRTPDVDCSEVATDDLLGEMTSTELSGSHFTERRHRRPAHLLRIRTPRIERAARRDAHQVGRQSL